MIVLLGFAVVSDRIRLLMCASWSCKQNLLLLRMKPDAAPDQLLRIYYESIKSTKPWPRHALAKSPSLMMCLRQAFIIVRCKRFYNAASPRLRSSGFLSRAAYFLTPLKLSMIDARRAARAF